MIWKNGGKMFWPGWNSFSECVSSFCREGPNAGKPGPCPDPEKAKRRAEIKAGKVKVEPKKIEAAKKDENGPVTDDVKPGQKVKVSGAEYTYVATNQDGTHKVRNAEGGEFNTNPGEPVTPLELAPRKNPGVITAKNDYVKAELEKIKVARAGNLRNAVSNIAEFVKKTGEKLPIGISPVQVLMTKRRLGEEERKLLSAYNVAKKNLEVDDAGDRKHHERVHRASVESALAAGKPVPPEVLKDYPDLAAKAPKPAKPSKTAKTTKPKPPGLFDGKDTPPSAEYLRLKAMRLKHAATGSMYVERQS